MIRQSFYAEQAHRRYVNGTKPFEQGNQFWPDGQIFEVAPYVEFVRDFQQHNIKISKISKQNSLIIINFALEI